MPEWIVSKPDKTAYIDLRDDGLTFTEAERLLDTIRPYYGSRSVGRIGIDVRGMDPIPGPINVLVAGVEARAATIGVGVDVVTADPAASRD